MLVGYDKLVSTLVWKNKLGSLFQKDAVHIIKNEKASYFDPLISHMKKLEEIEDFNNKGIFK